METIEPAAVVPGEAVIALGGTEGEVVGRRLAELTVLYATAPVGLALLDAELRYLSINETLAGMNGVPIERTVGRLLREVLPTEIAGSLEPLYRRVVDSGEPFLQIGIRFPTRTRPVEERHWLVSLHPVHDSGGVFVGVSSVILDVTERERLASEAQQRALVLETANRVALDILAQETGVEALRHIAEAARTLAGARYAALGVARTDGHGLQEFVTTGLTTEEEAAIGPRPSGKGVLGLLLTYAEPLRISALASHPASVGFPPNHPPMRSFLGVPIRRGDTVLGSLYLTNKENGKGFTEADEVAVQALGAHAAIAIHHLRLLTRQRALLSSLINAQEEERRAIAYDLHDGLTQYVMAAHAHLGMFRSVRESGDDRAAADAEATPELEQGLRYLKEAVLESRRLVNGLRALALDDLGLAGALEQLLNEEKARTSWGEADFLHNVAGRRFDASLETTVYRVAQEALTNARKHAGATRVRVTLLYEESSPQAGAPYLKLEVRDWGKGFVPEERVSTDGSHGFGLHGMIERIHLAGGRYDLNSTPGEGTRVRAAFPVLEMSSSRLQEDIAEAEGEI